MEVEVWEELSLPRLEWCGPGAETWGRGEALSPTSARSQDFQKGEVPSSPLFFPTPVLARPPAPFRTSFSPQVRKA